jgi:hypothetical protein
MELRPSLFERAQLAHEHKHAKRMDLDGLEISGLKHRRSPLPAIPWPLDRPRHHYCEWNGDIAAEKYGTTGAGDAPKAEKVRSDVEPQQFNIRSSQPATGQDQIALPMARRVALSR